MVQCQVVFSDLMFADMEWSRKSKIKGLAIFIVFPFWVFGFWPKTPYWRSFCLWFQVFTSALSWLLRIEMVTQVQRTLFLHVISCSLSIVHIICSLFHKFTVEKERNFLYSPWLCNLFLLPHLRDINIGGVLHGPICHYHFLCFANVHHSTQPKLSFFFDKHKFQ